MSLRNLKGVAYLCVFISIVCIISALSKSNSVTVDHTFVKTDDVGGTGGDVPAIRALNGLVQANFLDRDYYEASSIETSSGLRIYANYNKKHQALFIGTADGWSFFYYATPAELNMIADHSIPAHKLHEFLRPFPEERLDEIPTRSRSWSLL